MPNQAYPWPRRNGRPGSGGRAIEARPGLGIEEGKLERIDGDAVGRTAGACLLEQTRIFAADVGGEEFELNLPVGMSFGEFPPEGKVQGRLADSVDPGHRRQSM